VVGRDFDGDVDVVRQVFASRDLAVAHGVNSQGGAKKVGRIIGVFAWRYYAVLISHWSRFRPPCSRGVPPADAAGGRECPGGRTVSAAGTPRERPRPAGPGR